MLSPQQREGLKNGYMEKFRFIEIYKPEQDKIDYWLSIIDSILTEKQERIEKLFEEVEEREDRVEVSDVINILKE